jgi:hypothetical protein
MKIGNCLNNSYQISFIQSKLKNEEMFNDNDLQEITRIKQINNPIFYQSLSNFFHKFNRVKVMKKEVRSKRK